MKYTLKKLQSMPTIRQGQYDDLKSESYNTRVWLSRMTIEDGMPYNNQVTIEKYQFPKKYNRNGKAIINDMSKPPVWEIVEQYEAK